MLRQISLGKVGLVVGGILAVMGFVAYGIGNSTLNLIGFFYGIPILLGGLALTASELTPVPMTQPTTAEVLALREQQATPTQNQIRNDVTRYRYGQRAHLDESLDRLGLRPTDEERPVLVGLYEKNWGGNYALVLQFFSPLIGLDAWKEKQDKIARFFGPGLRVELTQPDEEQIELALIVDS
jgi:hypothetical protein